MKKLNIEEVAGVQGGLVTPASVVTQMIVATTRSGPPAIDGDAPGGGILGGPGDLVGPSIGSVTWGDRYTLSSF